MDDKNALGIQSLLKHPGWKLLEEEIEHAHDRYMKTISARISGGIVLDQRELDFMRGRFDGAKMILRQPGRAISWLEKHDKESDLVV